MASLAASAVVILVPLAALATIAVALNRRWRARFAGWMVPVTVLPSSSPTSPGRAASNSSPGWRVSVAPAWPQTIAGSDWRSSGSCSSVFGLGVATWLAAHSRGTGPVPTIVAIATAIAAAVVLYAIIRVGHSGTQAVWGDLIKNT